MESFKKFIWTILLTIVLSFIILWGISKIFIPKWLDSDSNRMSYIIKGFYKEPKNTIDILFTGNSDVYRGISPMALYEKLGVTSYNFVSAGQRMWVGLPMLEEALRYQSPKIVFFNIDELFFTSKSVGNTHKVYDNMSFGLPKIKGIFDANYENNGKLLHFLPSVYFHDRYKELTFDDFKYAFYDYTDPLKGMDLVAFSKEFSYDLNYMEKSDEKEIIPEKNLEYLDKMRTLCEEKDIEFILIEIPSADSWNYKKHNAVEAYANDYNLKFLDLNLNLDEMNFDWMHDSSDGGDHLNIYGAEKVTNFIATFLEENYSLENHKEDEKYQRWHDHYQEYLRFKENAINGL